MSTINMKVSIAEKDPILHKGKVCTFEKHTYLLRKKGDFGPPNFPISSSSLIVYMGKFHNMLNSDRIFLETASFTGSLAGMCNSENTYDLGF